MAENKARDDKFVNKGEPYERDFIKKQYSPTHSDEIDKIIDKQKYVTHDDIYKKLKEKGFRRKG